MGYADLREFLADLDKRGELVRVRAPVDPVLEMGEIADRLAKRRGGGPAVLFENPIGSTIPVAMNLYGTPARVRLAVGDRDPRAIGASLAAFAQPEVPHSLREGFEAFMKMKDLVVFPPKGVRWGDCQAVVKQGADVRLSELPILKTWPLDGGRYVTLPLVITRDPETGKRNVGTYRMQVLDERRTAMHWQTHKGGAIHYQKAEARGERLAVAVAIGADPATMLAGILPAPDGIDEFLFAGYLRGARVPLVKCKTVDLEVPANAEIVLEGYVEPGERVREGPFGDHTGYYSMPDDFPVFHVTALTHRRDPIYPATIVGKPPMEDGHIGKAIERMFLPLIRLQLPEIVDMNLPVESVFHNLMIVSIKKRYPGHARKVMAGLWGMGQLMFTKIIVVVDDDVNVHDLREILWAFPGRYDPGRDTLLLDRMPTDTLDHAAPIRDLGGKLGIDATKKWPEEGYTREWPPVIEMDEETKGRVDARWKEYGLPDPAGAR
ncbi:MAG TPA: menaquinone biosynthesis decarboxylase [Candidatus Thermoplasmatota archaeon]|nr:menaquinone biosynthesis decarboxylase [Candidatus Thermoplasmatota archaeon]